jgi:hypothetical protein
MTSPLTSLDLDEIETRAAALYEYATVTDDEGQAAQNQLTDTDVPALVAEVRRLRDRVAELESPVEAKPSPAPGICRCGHRQAAHDSGEPGCSACPSTGNWDHPYRPSAAAPAVVSAR